MNVNVWPDRIIRWGFILLFGLVPILLTPWNYELFEYNKMMAVYALTVIIVGAWLVKSITQGKLRIVRMPLDIPILLFVTSQLVSSIFSIDPHVSWFGYYSRFNGGMFSIISYVFLYYAFVSNVQNLQKLLVVALGSGAVVALYGVAERLGVDKNLWVQDVQNRVFSSLGQPNWLAAYLVALIPIVLGFALLSLRGVPLGGTTKQSPQMKGIASPSERSRNDIVSFALWCFIAALFFLVLLFTRSRSGLLGFAVADVVFWGLVFLKTKRIVLPFVIIHLAFVILTVFFGPSLPIPSLTRLPITQATPSAAYTAPLLETGGTESGTIRKYVWQGAINAWQSSLKTYLIGTGTETFAFAFYQFKPKEHNLTSEWDFLYNKAHNEYLNYLATTGIFGLGSYLLFIGAFIVWFFSLFRHAGLDPASSSKSKMDSRLRGNDTIMQVALFAGWISILVTNFFGFSVVILQVFLFLFPAMAIAGDQSKSWSIPVPRKIILFFIFMASFIVLALLALWWHADTLFASGYRMTRAGQYASGAAFLKQAVAINPIEPYYYDELGSAYAGSVTDALESKDATLAATLVRQSLEASDRALSISPANVNYWKTRTKIYYSFSEFDPVFNDAAIEALEKAGELSPNDPKITYNLSILYGRKGINDKAIELLKTTIDLKPNYRDAYYALWVFYTEARKSELAKKLLQDYLVKVDPNDKDFIERIGK
ncbi:MAG: O-antigen ligase family protein [Patescibacteria group bacterium]